MSNSLTLNADTEQFKNCDREKSKHLQEKLIIFSFSQRDSYAGRCRACEGETVLENETDYAHSFDNPRRLIHFQYTFVYCRIITFPKY